MSNYIKTLRPEEIEGLIDEQLKEITELKECLDLAKKIADESPELNMSNYSHDDVDLLNNAMCEVFNILEAYR